MKFPWWLPLGGVPEIAVDELAATLENGSQPQIVDVRSASEYSAGHIRGAISAPIQSFRQTYPTLGLDANRPVVVICRTAHRSIPATRLLNNDGYDARQLARGMNAWWGQDLPTVSG